MSQFVLYEEDGGFKAATVMTDMDSSLQVETPHGKRSKIKASAVLLRFKLPGAGELMAAAQEVAEAADADFLWEVSGLDEFGFADLARDYFGHEPSAPEAAGILLKLHASPMHFYKKGKGRYKPAPAEALAAAKASVEKKRLQAEQMAGWVNQLVGGQLPEPLAGKLAMLLYRPDRNTLEVKALEEACQQTGLTARQLLEKCGAIPSPHDYHLNAFLFEHFPGGTDFPADLPHEAPGDLPLADAQAFSIDDASTTEIDDAFSLVKRANGTWRLGIHIAVPALGILPESPMDKIGVRRLSTVYMPGNKITMLPEALIQDYTLQEGRVCPALSLYVDFDPATGAVSAAESRAERIEIAANLRHENLDRIFTEEAAQARSVDTAFGTELAELWHFAGGLEAGRMAQGAGTIQAVDYSFRFDGDRIAIVPRVRGNPVDKVVSELMILANSQWAKQLAEADIPAIFRSQQGGKVRMSTNPGKHQGLGVSHYFWATSPLRRYVDLINQRQLLAWLGGTPLPYSANSADLFSIIRDFDVAYDAYNQFQRGMERYWCLRYIAQESMDELTGVVLKENLVRVDGMPLVTRVLGMPEQAPGTRVRLKVGQMDLLERELELQFTAVMPAA